MAIVACDARVKVTPAPSCWNAWVPEACAVDVVTPRIGDAAPPVGTACHAAPSKYCSTWFVVFHQSWPAAGLDGATAAFSTRGRISWAAPPRVRLPPSATVPATEAFPRTLRSPLTVPPVVGR